MCFGLRTCRRYGSFAVKITSEVSFFVAHSGISSCSRYTQMVISVCNLPNGRERAVATGVLLQLTVCQSHSHCLRHHRSGGLLGARTVTEREYHYALCGSQRNRELPGILSRWISLAEKQVMAYRSARSPQRERIWQVNIQFSRFRKGKRHGSFLRDRDQDNRRCRTAEKVPFTIHDIFRRFINGVKAFIYRLFTFDVLMRWKFRIWSIKLLDLLPCKYII